MERHTPDCPDCSSDLSRRHFLQATAAVALASGARLAAAPTTKKPTAETAVQALYATLSPDQRSKMCFPWDHTDARGLLRTHVSNNWQITPHRVTGDKSIYTKDQQALIREVFRGLVHPAWEDRFLKQLHDDSGGKPWGAEQSIAIFGQPGTDQFEMVLTGRHQTLRADGNTARHVAFGGPIFYGHAAEGFNEKPNHPGNVFWPQAQAANGVYAMLDEKQRKRALIETSPKESAVGFRGKKMGMAPGLPVAEMSADQKAEMQRVLAKLIEPFRTDDQHEALACLKAQGGLDTCVLSFFEDSDIGDDKVWDNWRLEGPAFVWYFRGDPHVHVWVNIADDPSVKTNAKG